MKSALLGLFLDVAQVDAPQRHQSNREGQPRQRRRLRRQLRVGSTELLPLHKVRRSPSNSRRRDMRALSMELRRREAFVRVQAAEHFVDIFRAHGLVVASSHHHSVMMVGGCRDPEHLYVILDASCGVAQQVVGSINVENLRVL